MEITLKAEIGNFDEDGFNNFDLKQEVSKRVSEKIYNKIENEVSINISKTVTDKINQLIDDTYNNFLNQDIIITDEYGDEKTKGKLKDIIKHRFDNFMTEKVDENGRPNGYRSNLTRAEYFIESILKKHTDRFTKDTIETVTKELEKQLEKDLKNAIGKTIVDKIGLKNLLPNKIK